MLLLLLLSTGIAACEIQKKTGGVQKADVNQVGGFKMHPVKMNLSAAKDVCLSEGGQLDSWGLCQLCPHTLDCYVPGLLWTFYNDSLPLYM